MLGTIPWKVVPDVFSTEVRMNISRSVLVKMMLMLLPPSMNTRDMSYLAILALRTRAVWAGLGTAGG